MSQVKAMSAVERIESLLDAGSFIEIGASVHARNTDFNMPEKQTPAGWRNHRIWYDRQQSCLCI